MAKVVKDSRDSLGCSCFAGILGILDLVPNVSQSIGKKYLVEIGMIPEILNGIPSMPFTRWEIPNRDSADASVPRHIKDSERGFSIRFPAIR